ncbi:MAG TPA: phosphohistidine phosphatase SixA [Chthonomonadales bacterium]|nr:phosphohistidine phosphatase SixA [Chthonomonadales bacterium]
MQLYLLRHGIAEDGGWNTPDHARRLTPEGIEQMRAEAEALRRMKLKLDLILSSPLVRARQTAEIVADVLEMRERLRDDPRLASGCRLGDLQGIIADYPQAKRLMLVGHNPDLSLLTGQLVGGANVSLKKGGIARINIDRIEPGEGELEWLLTPAILLSSTA